MEVIHVADETGRRCSYCDEPIAHPKAPAFREGDLVVVLDDDPCASWKTRRSGNCQGIKAGWREGLSGR